MAPRQARHRFGMREYQAAMAESGDDLSFPYTPVKNLLAIQSQSSRDIQRPAGAIQDGTSRPANASNATILALPDELLLDIITLTDVSKPNVPFRARMEKRKVWTYRQAMRKIFSSALVSATVPTGKAASAGHTEHHRVRLVSRKFKAIADDVYSSNTLFVCKIRPFPDRFEDLALNKFSMQRLLVDNMQHVIFHVLLMVEEPHPRVPTECLMRTCIFHLHARPAILVKCTQMAADDKSRRLPLPPESMQLDRDYAQAVVKKCTKIMQAAEGGRGWISKVLDVMALGMDLSRPSCGYATQGLLFTAIKDKVRQMEADTREEEGEVKA